MYYKDYANDKEDKVLLPLFFLLLFLFFLNAKGLYLSYTINYLH